MTDSDNSSRLRNHGCPVCDWDGDIAESHDYDHKYFTHVIERDGELFQGKTCSMRIKPKPDGLLKRLLKAVR